MRSKAATILALAAIGAVGVVTASPNGPVVREPVVAAPSAAVTRSLQPADPQEHEVRPSRASRARPSPSPKASARKVVRQQVAHVHPAARRATPQASSGLSVGATLARIRGCESGSGPSSPGNYQAENPNSTASGAYQFLNGTWTSVTGLRPPASAYSRVIQDRAAIKLFDGGSGAYHWNASRHCWG